MNDSSTIILNPEQCWELLRAVEVGRLAVAENGRPDIFPINFVVDGDVIVFRTGNGTKLAAAVLSPAVAFEADGYDPVGGVAWSVVVKGRATEIDGLHGLFAALQLPLFPWHASRKDYFVRIDADEITGRRFAVMRDAARPTAPDNGPA